MPSVDIPPSGGTAWGQLEAMPGVSWRVARSARKRRPPVSGLLAGYTAETKERRSARNHNLPARYRRAQLTERRANVGISIQGISDM